MWDIGGEEAAGQAEGESYDSGPQEWTQAEKPEQQEQTQQGEQTQPVSASFICVHVCGAVKCAGVYELPEGSRVCDAVKEAGGFADNADVNYVNQAQQLSDGVKLVIPTLEQSQGQPQDVRQDVEESAEQIGIVGQDAADKTDGRININTASEAQLCDIPGIGASRAAAIVAYREESGGFSSVEDIMNVSGIKEGTFEKIKDMIKVK